MTVVQKYAIRDRVSKEYFVEIRTYPETVFSTDITRAKLYVSEPAVIEALDYAKLCSKRDLAIVEVKITFEFIKESNLITATEEKKLLEFKRLDAIAEQNIDLLSEKDFKKWRRLKNEYQT